jgi:hypothetical protein
LIYQWIEVTTLYKMTESTMQTEVCASMYKEGNETASVEEIVEFLAKKPEIGRLVEIFSRTNADGSTNPSRLSALSKQNLENMGGADGEKSGLIKKGA